MAEACPVHAYNEDSEHMPHTTQDESAKSERFHIRATTRQASLIKAGAARRNANLTEYIVDSTCTQEIGRAHV